MNEFTDDQCFFIETVRRISTKIHRQLVDALERTPHIISSRKYIETSLKLSESLINISKMLEESFCNKTESDLKEDQL